MHRHYNHHPGLNLHVNYPPVHQYPGPEVDDGQGYSYPSNYTHLQPPMKNGPRYHSGFPDPFMQKPAPPPRPFGLVTEQPQRQQHPQRQRQPHLPAQFGTQRDWQSGLCDCCNDSSVCCMTCCCYPCMLCELSKRMGEERCAPACMPSLLGLRVKMRTMHDIQGSVNADDITTCCCPSCALCQMRREHDNITNQQQMAQTMMGFAGQRF